MATTYNREQVIAVIREFRAADNDCLRLSPGKEYNSACDKRKKLRTRAREMIESAPEQDQAELESMLSQLRRYKSSEVETEQEVEKTKRRRFLSAMIVKHKPLARTIVEKIKTAKADEPIDRNEVFKSRLEQQISLRLAQVGIIQVDTLEKGAENRRYWYDGKRANKPALSELYGDD